MKEKKEIDSVFPFQIDNTLITGRYVSLDSVLTKILTRHTYPDIVNNLLAELILMGILLSSIFKYAGTLIVQVKGTGPIGFIVAEVTSDGHVRACAKLNNKEALTAIQHPTLKELFGEGLIIFTVDQGTDTDLYQGIVELKGSTLQEAFNHYFSQSQQAAITVQLAVQNAKTKCHGIGVLLNHLPGFGGTKAANEEYDSKIWANMPGMLKKLSPSHINRSPQTNLESLFEGLAITIYDTKSFKAKCRCSRGRIINLLRTFPKEEIVAMKIDDIISVTCEFCNKKYDFKETDFRLELVPTPPKSDKSKKKDT